MRRVVIVEGDGEVAEGLRRTLRSFARAWEVRVVATAQAALAAMPVDAVVCESAHPDVEPLLVELKERHPRVARTVLAPADLRPDAWARLQVLSHQVVKKPFLPAALVEAVERTAAVVETLTSERLKTVVGQLGELPPLPATYSRISQMSQDPDVSMDAIAATVERDPAITAAVLRIINSAYFGLPRRVSSVRETVRYLGIVPLKNLVLTVELFEGLALGKRAVVLQQEALLRAYAMRELLGQTPLADEAFVAGILADVGNLLLIARLPLDAMAVERRTDVLPWVAQKERLGCSAADIGAQLLTRWNLAPSLVQAVALHHHPLGAPSSDVTTALALVSSIEWSFRAPVKEQAAFQARADELVAAFPVANLDRLARYFDTRQEKTA
jgi:HD-like signal output (HDOD) protein